MPAYISHLATYMGAMSNMVDQGDLSMLWSFITNTLQFADYLNTTDL